MKELSGIGFDKNKKTFSGGRKKASLTPWEELPAGMRIPEVLPYYESLEKKKLQLQVKRVFDISAASVGIVVLAPAMILISFLICMDSPGEVFFRQVRVTTNGRKFRIHKFRTMIKDAQAKGRLITGEKDERITRVGAILRKYRLDEIPQLFDILHGDMSFVGVRPEVPDYVKKYTREMRATLLMPAGVTSDGSIFSLQEPEMLRKARTPEEEEEIYLEEILPEKMKINLHYIKTFSIRRDLELMVKTVAAVISENASVQHPVRNF